jgi:xylan 1,4-beta-xylosidase
MTIRPSRSVLAALVVLAISATPARAQPRGSAAGSAAGSAPGAEPGAGQTWTADNGNGTFSNPLFYDEFSDCDLIRVGKDFYLTGTTMHSMPGLPILHSRDLVNWRFLAYAFDTLDLGPAFRLEEGKQIYGRGIWAPSFRFHKGTFHIFSNVNGEKTQLFRATNPAGPWTRTAMKRSFHDLSVLFDDDGKAYVVWGYRGIRLAELTPDLLDIVPGTEREIIGPGAGMGEGLHLYKIRGKYVLTSAWFLDEMRMPTARADRLTGPWEVNQDVSRGEDFGFAEGNRLQPRAPGSPPAGAPPVPFVVRAGNADAPGRNAIHQGGIVDTPTGEWWGFSMMDANSVGRLTALSPVTWSEGWPYFGLPKNLGRSPRTWVTPRTGTSTPPAAPYQRSDDFSAPRLQPIWQWNHVPVAGKWSLTERRGHLRLHTLDAPGLLAARNTLTQRAIGPRSTATVVLDASSMLKPGDSAGLALFTRPYAWLGVSVDAEGPALTYVTEEGGRVARVPLAAGRVWLRAACDFLGEEARFSYSTDGRLFRPIGDPFRLVFQLMTFQGVRYSLFAFGSGGGFADFDAIDVREPDPRGLTVPIPYGHAIELSAQGQAQGPPRRWQAGADDGVQVGTGPGTKFTVIDRGLGRVALRGERGLVSVGEDGVVALRAGAPGDAETFQWIETFTGELTLLSLATQRYVRLDADTGVLRADARGPHPNRRDGVRWAWSGPADLPVPRTDANSRLAHEQLLAKRTQGRIDVYFVGDSITRRWGATDYPDFLAHWNATFSGWNAGDFGWGADGTQHILWRLQHGELDGVDPKVIVILAGTNNVGSTAAPPGKTAEKVADVTSGLKAIVDLCRRKAPRATIVLTAIFPRNDNMAVLPEIEAINANLAKLADGRAVRFLNVNDTLADARGTLFEGMAGDKLHPTLKGYQAWADGLTPILAELLGPRAAADLAPPPTGDPSARPRPVAPAPALAPAPAPTPAASPSTPPEPR